jgi:eukaryotic-like serine/threonine-protein kinase
MAFYLLRCLAGAVARHGVKFVCHLVPGGEALYEVAADAYRDYRQGKQEDALRAEVQALALAPAEQVRREVQSAVEAEAAHLPAEERQQIAAYLNQVPAQIRRSLRRPSDPTGTTVPASLALCGPDDLLPFLPPQPPRFRPGEQPLPGVDWVLDEPLGIGGFGEVWKARHAHLRSIPPVALKFCLDPSAVTALRNEAGVLDRVMQHGRHPGIVPLLHTYLSATPPCLEYEYVAGGELTAVIQGLHGQGQLTPVAASRLLLRLARIVGHAHRLSPPIVHRDLKPANVLVQRAPDGQLLLRVADFGIGGIAADRALQQSSRETTRGQALTALRGACTPLYASPEQRRGERPDPRDDVHALGVIWYQLLTGDLNAEAPRGLQWYKELRERGMSEGLLNLLASCVESRAANRPADAFVVAEALARELPAEAVPASQPVAPPPQPVPVTVLPRVVPASSPQQPGPRVGSASFPAAAAPLDLRMPGLDDTSRGSRVRQGIFLTRVKHLLELHTAAARTWTPLPFLGGVLVFVALVLLFQAGPDNNWGLVLAILGSALFTWLFWWIGKVRRIGRRRLVQEMIQALVRQHPQEVERWGGGAVLRDVLAVRELIRLLERETA